eukprot:1833311-Pyramimonas_sp.AAC.1
MNGRFVCLFWWVSTGRHPLRARASLLLGLSPTRGCPRGPGRLGGACLVPLRSLRPPTQSVAVRAVASRSRASVRIVNRAGPGWVQAGRVQPSG